MKLLLVEDDQRTSAFILKGLRQEGWAADHAADGADGLRKVLRGAYDVVIVDVMLPKLDGLSLIARIRDTRIAAPVLVLSARASVDDRVKGLQAGGDDYLVKPFAFSELIARIQALVRRATRQTEPTTLAVADLEFDLVRRKVTRAGKQIHLQPKELSLLEYFMRNKGRVISKTMIMEHVWDCAFDPDTNVVEVRVCRLRDKIDRSFERPLIRTMRGVGYVLDDCAP